MRWCGWLVGALVACGPSEHPALSLTGDGDRGVAVYAGSCSVCHGPDYAGHIGPSLLEVVPPLSDEELVDVMANGSGTMTALPLSDQEIADVVALLREVTTTR